jgi:amino acid transporter
MMFVALGTAITIFIVSASYSQIIELFPAGGGGYLVASKLLSPNIGMVSGCALIIDYILTITLSVTSGIDAIFSFLPPEWISYKLVSATVGIAVLILLNLRGVKESVTVLLPVFLLFVIVHFGVIVYILGSHLADLPAVATKTGMDISKATSALGGFGAFVLILRAYSMGAGTYTGIEAVSNALPILREPRVQTGKKTMRYMSWSLAFMAVGLMVSYSLMHVQHAEGKTLNAILFEKLFSGLDSSTAYIFVTVILTSEAVLLFVAAQTGFLGGPQILSNMAVDRWFPTRFATLSDRLVTQNGVLIIGAVAAAILLLTGGNIRVLVVMYSINVFITFSLSQLGMVRHWLQVRSSFPQWKRKITINGIGLFLTSFILASVVIIKFTEGGWVTILLTGGLVSLVILFKRHYIYTGKMLRRLDDLVLTAVDASLTEKSENPPQPDTKAKTAVFLVNSFSGLGLHTLFTVMRTFDGTFKNFVFVQVGILDAGNFKGAEEVDSLRQFTEKESAKYVNFMHNNGYSAEAFCDFGTDVVEVVGKIAPQIVQKYPHSIFFGGQVVFPKESILTRWLHNFTVFAVQRRLYFEGIPVVVLPIRI